MIIWICMNLQAEVILVMGDVRNSRNIDDFPAVSDILRSCLSTINRVFDADIASNFALEQGDQIEGVLYKADSLFLILEQIQRSIYPHRLRFSISVGNIVGAINKTSPFSSNSLSWQASRDLLEGLEKDETKHNVENNMCFWWKCRDKEDDLVLNNTKELFNLASRIRGKWSPNQEELFSALMVRTQMSDAYSLKEAAKTLSQGFRTIYLSNLSRSINHYGYLDYLRGLKQIEDNFKWYLSKHEF